MPGLREATAAAWCLAIGFTVVLLRGGAPDALTIPLGNSMIGSGVALQYMAYRRFNDPSDRSRRPLYFVLGATLAFGLAWRHGASYQVRALFSSAVIATLMLSSAWELARDGGLQRERSRAISLGLVGLTGLCMVLRVGLLVVQTGYDPNLLAPSLERSIAFFPTMLYTLGGGLGFMVMLSERGENRSRELSLTDALTGCANRRALEERVRAELDHARRAGRPVSLVVVDIDRFKSINDAHGHAAGDEVIRRVGAVLRAGVRTSDVVARYGGEEFCVLLRDADAEVAETLAGRLRRALNAAVIATHGVELQVTASFGVASFDPITTETWETLFHRADETLFRAKRGGRDRVEMG